MKYFLRRSTIKAMAGGKEFSAVAQLFMMPDGEEFVQISVAGDPLVEIEVTIKEQRKEESGT